MSRSSSFSLRSEQQQPKPPVIDDEALRRWVVAFCVVRFDLEQGQVIEECYPPSCLSQDEELETAFNSFPDSVSQQHNRSSIHDCIFFFRFRRRGSVLQGNVPLSEMIEVDKGEGKSRDVGNGTTREEGVRFLYGYVFNRQRHDERLRRGGEQKSVVILSHCPYSSLFRPLLQIMGPLFFDIGKKALEHIAAYVSSWPAPVPGKLMELPIGNATLKVNLPPSHSMPLDGSVLVEDSASFMVPSLATNQSIPQGLFHDVDLFGIFRGIILQLWVLWELLIIGEPILIFAPTPPQCCEAVAGLVSLIAPLLCSVDFRPYFTIHDPDFGHLNSLPDTDSFPPMILGVTNLFFLKSLRNVPHVVSVGSPISTMTRGSIALRSSNGRSGGRSEGLGVQQLSLRRFSPSSLLNAVKLRREGPLCLMTEHKEAIWTTYAATTKPDTSILNRLIDAGTSPRIEESMSVVNNEILRRHFLEFTTNFLAPFAPYFKINTPSEGSSPFVDPPPLLPFNAEEFLLALAARGPGKFLSKRMRSNWLDLYRRFLKGQNFKPWFTRRRLVAEQEQHRLWKQARLKADIRPFISKMSEVEVVDSFNAIERHLIGELKQSLNGQDSVNICQKLQGDLQQVFDVLPIDMQQLLMMNPERAALIQGDAAR